MLEQEGDGSEVSVLVSRHNPHLADASSSAIHCARRSHLIKYETITGHFTAQWCLFGWNSVVVSEKTFSRSVRAWMGMRLKKKMSYQCLPGESSRTAQEQWQHTRMEGCKLQRWGQGWDPDGSTSLDSWQLPLNLVPLGTRASPDCF